jgi:Tol biopolymer transport system component
MSMNRTQGVLLALVWLGMTGLGIAADKAADRPRGTIAFASQAPRGWDVYATDLKTGTATRLTDHPALDFNAAASLDGQRVAFVSERDGNMEIYSMKPDGSDPRRLTHCFALNDHPSWSPDGKRLVFTSTRQPAARPGQSWNALYVMNADGSGVKRLSPPGAVDYSPAWSPGGDAIAFVSEGQGVGVMKPDGSGRRVLVKGGGWPAFMGPGQWLYFHKNQGNWGIWRVRLDGSGQKRVSPSGLDVCTPSGSAAPGLLAVAVLQGNGRQIELLDPATGKLSAVTQDAGDHWNPSLSPDGGRVYYHKITPLPAGPRVEEWGRPPGSDLRMLRIVEGMFPAFSPDGKQIACIDGIFPPGRFSLAVMNADGTGHHRIWTGNGDLFSLTWPHAGCPLAFARGGYFRGARTPINIATVRPDGSDLQTLVSDGSNTGWPSFSPDGKEFVFRSGRSGSKNLYIARRDGSGVRRLTEGNWTDTMCHWSPTGEWIVFASNRDGDFHLWLIKPDGTGLRKLLGGARHNHPHFSPDGKWVVFASSYAGTSVESVSLPRTDEPFGELFLVRLDGTGLTRLTHNGSSEGTPDWGPAVAVPRRQGNETYRASHPRQGVGRVGPASRAGPGALGAARLAAPTPPGHGGRVTGFSDAGRTTPAPAARGRSGERAR